MKGKSLPIYAKLSRGKRLNSKPQAQYSPTQTYSTTRPSHHVTTLAGRHSFSRVHSNFTPGVTHEVPIFHSGIKNGSAHKALFSKPWGIALDAQQNLWVSDTYKHCIRLITPRGRVCTLSGGPRGHQDGRLGDALFNQPTTLRIQNHRVYVLEPQSQSVRMIHQGEVFTLPLMGQLTGGLAIDSQHQIYYTALLGFSDQKVCLLKRTAQGEHFLLVSHAHRVQWLPYLQGDENRPFTLWTSSGTDLPEPVFLNWSEHATPLALDAQDRLYLFQGQTLMRLYTSGSLLQWEPRPCHWLKHPFRSASDLVITPEGHALVTEPHHGRIYRISPEGDISHLGGDSGAPYPTLNTLSAPQSLVLDPLGRIFLADTGHWRICRLDPPGGDPWQKILRFFAIYMPHISQKSPVSKGLIMPRKPIKRQKKTTSSQDRPLPPSLVLPLEHLQGIVQKGTRQQVLECSRELCETLKSAERPSLHPALPVLKSLLTHPEVSVRTLLYKELPQCIHNAKDALQVIHLLDQEPDSNRILRRYRLQLLVYLGEQFQLYNQVIPHIVEGLKDPEDSVSEYVFELLQRLRQKGLESLIDPLVEELAHD